MGEHRHFLIDKFCEDIEFKAEHIYNTWVQALKSDLLLCYDDNEKLDIINSKRNEIRKNLEGSEYKTMLSINDIKNDLTINIVIYFETKLLSLTKIVTFDESIRFGQYELDYSTGLLTLRNYLGIDSIEQYYDFGDLDEFKPFVDYIAWGKMFIRLKKLDAKIKRKIISDQKSLIPIYNTNAAEYDDDYTDTKVKSNRKILYTHLQEVNRIKVKKEKPSVSDLKQNKTDILEIVNSKENIEPETTKESAPALILKPKTTLDFLIGNETDKKNLFDYLLKTYSGKKGKSIAFMILALKENDLIDYRDKSELYNALRVDFGYIGSDQGINKHWTDVLCKNEKYLKLVDPDTKRIRIFMESLTKIVV